MTSFLEFLKYQYVNNKQLARETPAVNDHRSTLIMAAAFALIEQGGARRQPPVFRPRINHLLVYGDDELVARYRLDRHSIQHLIDVLSDGISRPTIRRCAVEPTIAILSSLRFLATGSFMSVIGDSVGISKATVSRCLASFIEAVNTSEDELLRIRFPTAEEARGVKAGFHEIAGFPNVLGKLCRHVVPVSKITLVLVLEY